MTFVQRHAYGFGAGFAALLWPFFRKRRRLSVANILKCGIVSSEKEALHIAKKSWCHLAGHICEALCVPNVVNASNWREHLEFDEADPETVKLLLDSPDEPILLVSAHHGVWEAATNVLSFARPMIAIARVMNNKFVASWMKKHHFRGPVTIIDKNRGFSPEILKQWKETAAAMTILMDQHTASGARLEFLGRPARTFTSATRLAMRSGRRIVCGSFVRIAPYRYRLVGGSPLSFPKDADRDSATQILNDRIGEAIRKYPEQYLWAHRRWRDD
ncbi:MAG: lysophospholipid acyltransferase family protein [Kiritimatiellae bacterium]|nr:lysophospholipid acyltransferase family protein [Kiritimatiellia bacterium]